MTDGTGTRNNAIGRGFFSDLPWITVTGTAADRGGRNGEEWNLGSAKNGPGMVPAFDGGPEGDGYIGMEPFGISPQKDEPQPPGEKVGSNSRETGILNPHGSWRSFPCSSISPR